MKHSPRAWLPGILLPAMMLIFFALSACKKGDESPQQPGQNTNMNAGTINVTNNNWTYPGNYSGKHSGSSIFHSTKYTDIPAPEITEEIVKNGLVQVYFNPSDDGSFISLPFRLESISHNYNFSFEYSKGKIRVHFYFTPNQHSGTLPSLASTTVKDYVFKYIVVPGPMSIKMQKDGIRLSEYETVTQYASVNH
ncbi:hypothetical protein [Pseudobacter ginsenosidimutans]|jgi:hypothetical protein|uniref:Uncharacterized protein n=1 Tax=Pseudobacter ginsenosidimutans TaxID=661488 RepID=A0A4V2F153_9BACT|nr:hypothetical protein [Pseudobacter ginsenosidimutans]QEC40837.1 hypothetical protein FSB84_03675 [Pseudobacter ginsenosidimutans]RZS72431.1 hypothetical protein EV199_4352 [Pseudobacter ginsenosidimutans]